MRGNTARGWDKRAGRIGSLGEQEGLGSRLPLELFSISETSSVSWSDVHLYERTPSTLL